MAVGDRVTDPDQPGWAGEVVWDGTKPSPSLLPRDVVSPGLRLKAVTPEIVSRIRRDWAISELPYR